MNIVRRRRIGRVASREGGARVGIIVIVIVAGREGGGDVELVRVGGGDVELVRDAER